MKLALGRTAIVLVEFQNQWLREGLYHRLIRGQVASRNVLENATAFVEQARQMGVTIVHAPLVIDPRKKKGWLARATFGKVFTKDTWRAQIPAEVLAEGDLAVKGRYAFDAFVGSDLKELLDSSGIRTVFLCGFTTDQCVAKTMKTALEEKLDAYLVSDCTATINGWLQRRTERKFDGRVVDYRAVLGAFRRSPKAPAVAP
jgi:nicotinamidase-related amidase